MKLTRNAHASDVLILSRFDVIRFIVSGKPVNVGSLIVRRETVFDITYGWSITKRNTTAEGGSSMARRVFGRLFLREKYTKIN